MQGKKGWPDMAKTRTMTTFAGDNGREKVTDGRKDTFGAFEEAKRALEEAYRMGNDYGPELMELSTIIARACINKCLDPQRTTAGARDKVSDNGFNPALLALRRGIGHDKRIIESVLESGNKALHATIDKDGEPRTVIADKAASARLDALMGETLTDGLDLVNAAVEALLEQFNAYYAGQEAFLDTPYVVTRLAKKVYIQSAESKAYRDEETTPIREVYRAVRRVIQSSAAVKVNPANAFVYVEAMDVDELETAYIRLQKYADLGGKDTSGNYTGDSVTARDYNDLIARLKPTRRQTEIIRLRMQGHGYKAIASFLGVKRETITCAMKRLRQQWNDTMNDTNEE